MPLGELAGEAIGGMARVIGRLLVECVFELLIQGTGHLVLKAVRPHREPGETGSTVVGLLVWIAIGVAAYWVHGRVTA